jgi:hypothetical protein
MNNNQRSLVIVGVHIGIFVLWEITHSRDTKQDNES